MSKIKIEEIYACQERNTKGAAVDAIMSLIKQREAEWEHTADLQKQTYDDEVELLKAQYGELKSAAVEQWTLKPDTVIPILYDALQPFLPPPSLADKLDALAANSAMVSCSLRRVLRAIAAEYREKHGGGEWQDDEGDPRLEKAREQAKQALEMT